MNSQTERLVQSALMAAVYMVLFLMAVYLPVLGLICFIALPLPFIVQQLRLGWRSTLLTGLVTLFLSSLLAPLPAVLITVLALSVGLVMGHYYAQKHAPFFPLLAGILTYLANYALVFLLSYFLFDLNLMTLFEEMLEDSLAFTQAASSWLVPADQRGLINAEELIRLSVNLLPGMLIISSIVMAWLNHGVARPLLSRFGFDLQALPPLYRWNLPKSILPYYLVVLVITLLGLVEEGSSWFMLVINLHLVLEMLLWLQGLTFVDHLAYVKQMGRFLLPLAIILSFIPLIAVVIRIIGILDMGMNLKERFKE